MTHATPAFRQRAPARDQGAASWSLVLLALAVGAGAVSWSRWASDPRRWLFSYLTALVFVTSISIGALAWLMLQHLTRGRLVGGHPPAAGKSDAAAALARGRLPPHRSQPAADLFLGRSLAGGRGPRAGPQGGLARPVVLQCAGRRLPGALGPPGRAAGAELGPPGPDVRPARQRSHAGDEHLGPGRAGADHEFRRLRLADVARARTGRRPSSGSTSGRARWSARSPP